jgi:hypothetical protein
LAGVAKQNPMCEALAKAKDQVAQIVAHYDGLAHQNPISNEAKAR